MNQLLVGTKSLTPQKFSIAPENWWLEEYFPFGMIPFRREGYVKLQGFNVSDNGFCSSTHPLQPRTKKTLEGNSLNCCGFQRGCGDLNGLAGSESILGGCYGLRCYSLASCCRRWVGMWNMLGHATTPENHPIEKERHLPSTSIFLNMVEVTPPDV